MENSVRLFPFTFQAAAVTEVGHPGQEELGSGSAFKYGSTKDVMGDRGTCWEVFVAMTRSGATCTVPLAFSYSPC